MAIQPTKFIWRNGELIPWARATTHLTTHAIHYGTSVFEGMRAYDTHLGPAVFRNREHIERLHFSAKVYGIAIRYSVAELMEVCREIIRVNELKASYIRPIAYLGEGEMGPASRAAPSEVAVMAWPLGAYLGDDALKNGVDVAVASWRRLAPGTMPAGVKAGGNYLSSRLVGIEAKIHGYAEGIGLAHDGTVSEGAGENLFVVLNGRLITPPAAASILGGITRDAVMTLARDDGIEVVEQAMPREMLYYADEIFLTGTAAEITPVRSVDRIEVGGGNRGRPVTAALQKKFFGLFDGSTPDRWGWLDPVAK